MRCERKDTYVHAYRHSNPIRAEQVCTQTHTLYTKHMHTRVRSMCNTTQVADSSIFTTMAHYTLWQYIKCISKTISILTHIHTQGLIYINKVYKQIKLLKSIHIFNHVTKSFSTVHKALKSNQQILFLIKPKVYKHCKQ